MSNITFAASTRYSGLSWFPDVESATRWCNENDGWVVPSSRVDPEVRAEAERAS